MGFLSKMDLITPTAETVY